MKYLSPMKFSMELVLIEELKGSVFGQISLSVYDYTMGSSYCRYIMLGYFLLGRISAYFVFVHQTKKFV